MLQVSEKTIARMLQDGSIPGFKIANQWRFHSEDLERWLLEKRTGREGRCFPEGRGTPFGESVAPPLSRMADEEFILPDLPTGTKEETLALLAQPLSAGGIIGDAERFVGRLMDRENMMTTGIGGGLAIPHLRKPSEVPVERPLAVIGISREGIDWNAVDGEPVHVIVLPVAGGETAHLMALEAIRNVFSEGGSIGEISGARDSRDVIGRLIRLETSLRFSQDIPRE